MSNFRTAVTDLIITAVAASSDLDEVHACSQAVLAELPDASEDDLRPTLRRLADTIAVAPLPGAGVLALTAAALVEAGGPPGIVLKDLLERLEEVLESAAIFARACDESIELNAEQAARAHPREALAWIAIELMSLATLSLLERDPENRQRARERPRLRARLLPLRHVHERSARLLALLDAGEQAPSEA